MERNWIDKYFWQFIIITSIVITVIINLIKGFPVTTYPEEPYFQMLGNIGVILLFPYMIMIPYLIYQKMKTGKIPQEKFHNWYFGIWSTFIVFWIIGTLN